MESGKIQRIGFLHALSIFFILMLCWITAVIIIYVSPKHHIEIDGKHHVIFCGAQLAINGLTGNYFFDTFFSLITYCGDGWFALVMLSFCIIAKWRFGLLLTGITLLATISTNFLKNVIFPFHHRPFFIFKHYDIHAFSVIPNSGLHIHNSFPSGHTTQAFALFIGLALHIQNGFLRWCLVCLALLVGFSRIYLGQHWTQDVIAGSCIGTCYAFLGYILSSWFQDQKRLRFKHK